MRRLGDPAGASASLAGFRLETSGGSSVRVPRTGLLIGRGPESGVILADPAASQRHAILLDSRAGLQLFPLGRNPTLLNGRPAAAGAVLADGDVIEVPGGRFVLRASSVARNALARPRWITLPTGERYGVPTPRCSVGGGNEDDIRLPGWAAGAVGFQAAQHALLAVLGSPCVVNGELREAGEVLAARAGDRYESAGSGFALHAEDDEPGESTLVGGEPAGWAVAASFAFLPSGGRLELQFGDADPPVVVEPPELRARLFAVLLSPGGGFSPGDDVPDEVILAGVWPRAPGRDRGDLNQLVHRARRDLLAAGLDPERVLHRPKRGGSVRLLLGAGAFVRVE